VLLKAAARINFFVRCSADSHHPAAFRWVYYDTRRRVWPRICRAS